MDPIPKWKHSKALRALFVVAVAADVGCAGRPWVTAPDLAPAPRRPDGVLVEPPPALPHATDYAPSRGVIVLREPLAEGAATDVARAYVRAFEREDLEALSVLLSADAVPLFGGRGGRAGLIEQFRTRIKNYDYSRLAGAEVARFAAAERYSFDDLGIFGAPERPSDMRPGDILLRVPVATPRVGSEPLFGDVIVLLLRREEGHLRIAGVSEENGH